MKKKDLKNEILLGHFISFILIVIFLYFFFLKDKIIFKLFYYTLPNLILTFYFPIVYRPLNKILIFTGEFIGKIVSPVVFFIIFLALITPIGLFYRYFIYKENNEWIKSSEGNDDNFQDEY